MTARDNNTTATSRLSQELYPTATRRAPAPRNAEKQNLQWQYVRNFSGLSAKRTKLFRALPERPEQSWLRSIAKIIKKPIYGFSMVLTIVWFFHTRNLVKFSCVCGIKDPFWSKDVRCLTRKESRHRLTDVRNCRQCSILNEITMRIKTLMGNLIRKMHGFTLFILHMCTYIKSMPRSCT